MENINSFPLDVTDKSKCKEVFEKIKNGQGQQFPAAMVKGADWYVA